jgi:hypothetical protein
MPNRASCVARSGPIPQSPVTGRASGALSEFTGFAVIDGTIQTAQAGINAKPDTSASCVGGLAARPETDALLTADSD